MAASPTDVVHAGGIKEGFWIMTPPGLNLNTLISLNGKHLTPAKLLPVLLPNSSPFCAFYDPALSGDTLWTIYPEHLGHFVNETHDWSKLKTYGPKVCGQWGNCQMIDLTVLADAEPAAATTTKKKSGSEGEGQDGDKEGEEDEEYDEGEEDDIETDGSGERSAAEKLLSSRVFVWARALAFKGEELDWDNCSKEDQLVPQHICYLFLCDAVVGAVKIVVPPSVLAPVYGLAKSVVLRANHRPDVCAYYTRPMFPCINKTYKLFRGFELAAVFQGTKNVYESAAEYDSSSSTLLWNHQTMMKLVDNAPHRVAWWNYLHPSFKSRKTNRPTMFREGDVGYSMPSVQDTETWLQSDAFLCHLQIAYLTAFRMIMPASAWYRPVGPNLVDLGSLRMVQNRIITLLTKHTDTVMNIDGCKVMFGEGFGEVGLGKGAAKTTNNQKKYGDMIKVMMVKNATSNLAKYFAEKPGPAIIDYERTVAPELCTDFQIFGLWSAKNKYLGFTSVGTEGKNDSSVAEQREVEVLLDNDVCPFCCVSLALTVRQLLLGEVAGHMTWLIQEGRMTSGGMKEAVKTLVKKGFGMSSFMNFDFPDRGAEKVHSSEMSLSRSYIKEKMFRKLPSNRNIQKFLLKKNEVPVLSRGKIAEVACFLDHVKINKTMCYIPVTVQKNNYLQTHELILSKPQYYVQAPCLVKCYWRAFFGNTNSRNTKLALNFGTLDYRVTVMGNDHLSKTYTSRSGSAEAVRRPEIMAAEAVIDSLKTELYVERGVTKLNVRTINGNVPNVTKAMWEDLKKVMAEQKIVLNEDEECVYSDEKEAPDYDTDTDDEEAAVRKMDSSSSSSSKRAGQMKAVPDEIMTQSTGFTNEFNLTDVDGLLDTDTNGSLDEGEDSAEEAKKVQVVERERDRDRKRRGHGHSGYYKHEKQSKS